MRVGVCPKCGAHKALSPRHDDAPTGKIARHKNLQDQWCEGSGMQAPQVPPKGNGMQRLYDWLEENNWFIITSEGVPAADFWDIVALSPSGCIRKFSGHSEGVKAWGQAEGEDN